MQFEFLVGDMNLTPREEEKLEFNSSSSLQPLKGLPTEELRKICTLPVGFVGELVKEVEVP